jgi:hypothetical protein
MESDNVMVSPHGVRLQRTQHERREKTPDGKDIIRREIKWTPIRGSPSKLVSP